MVPLILALLLCAGAIAALAELRAIRRRDAHERVRRLEAADAVTRGIDALSARARGP